MAKPDNRADNEEHLQEHIDHTIANLEEAQEYLSEHADEISAGEKQEIKSKNNRRQESIQGFVEEKEDEAQH